MKTIYFFTLLFLITPSVFSQTSFVYNIGKEFSDESPYVSIQNADNEYIVAGQAENNLILIKISEDGSIMKHREWGLQDTVITAVKIISFQDSMTIILKVSNENISESRSILFASFDYELEENPDARFSFHIPNEKIKKIRCTLNSQNNIICAGIYGEGLTEGDAFLYETTLSGDSVNFKVHPQATVSALDVVDIEEINQTQEYLLTGNNFYYHAYAEIIKVDKNLEIDTVFTLYDPWQMALDWSHIKFDSDSTFLWNTLYFDYTDKEARDNRLIRLDTNFNSIGEVIVGNEREEYIPFFDWSFAANNSVFLANEYPFSAFLGFLIAKVDSDLNVLWEHFYDTDYHIEIYSSMGTNDGGCFICATYSEEGQPARNILLIKTDANGNFPTTNTPEIKPTELLLYPNPGSGQLNIRTAVQATGGTFYLYDMQGRMVLSETITDTHTPINTTELAPGSYIYQYVLKGELRESGKWMKN